MELKLQLNKLLEINKALKEIIDDTEVKMNVLLKFRLLGIAKVFEPYVNNFDVIRNQKIIEFGKENKEGFYQIAKDDTEALKKFTAELEQVLNSEVTVNMEMLKANEVFNSGLRSDYLISLFPIIVSE